MNNFINGFLPVQLHSPMENNHRLVLFTIWHQLINLFFISFLVMINFQLILKFREWLFVLVNEFLFMT